MVVVVLIEWLTETNGSDRSPDIIFIDSSNSYVSIGPPFIFGLSHYLSNW